MNCSSCGSKLDYRDVFCSHCGALTDRGKGRSELVSHYASAAARNLNELGSAAIQYTINPANRIKVLIGTGVLALLLVSLTSNPFSRGVAGLFAVSVDDLAGLGDDETTFLSANNKYEVVGIATVFDQPTEDGSRALEAFSQGDTVTAWPVAQGAAKSEWFELEGGRFISGANLVSTSAPSNDVTLEFPESIQGRWVRGFGCEGSGSLFSVEFIDDRFTEVGRSAKLVRSSINATGTPVFVLDMSQDDGQQYSGAFAVHVSSDGNAIIIDDLNMSVENRSWRYRDSLPCDEWDEQAIYP